MLRFLDGPTNSKFQMPEKISVARNPRTRRKTTTFITHGGASKVGSRIDAAWITNQATTT
jgi:hypothetical protein